MDDTGLFLRLMLEAGRRVQPDKKFWSKQTGYFARLAAQDAAYCLDAPNEIPTGSVLWFQVDTENGFPEPQTVSRDH